MCTCRITATLKKYWGIWVLRVLAWFHHTHFPGRSNSSCTKWQKPNSFGQSEKCFLVKKQGTCSKAVRIIPVPTGTEKCGCPRSRSTIYTVRNSTDITLAVILKAKRSFSLSFLASLSMGLQRKIWSVEATTKQVNKIVWCLATTNRIMNKKAESSSVDERRQIPGDFKWNPPLNFLISMKGRIISRPSITIPVMQPRITIRQRGNKLNKKL